MPFGFTHQPLVNIAGNAITSFYRKIEVYGAENVPVEGPIIFACSHTNMAIDPAVLSSTIPHGFKLHYWVKDSLFKHPAMKAMLLNAGNIPVDRKTKNNQKLFRGTFEALALGECIGVFPEGTSHTEPHLIALKDGVSWTALEYLVYLRGSPESGPPKEGKPAVIVPVGIAYCDKNKYRSRLSVTYGTPITMDAYQDEFLSGVEGANKAAVKRLTAKLQLELVKMTVNAPDWDAAFAAQMTRQLLWKNENDLALSDWVDTAQTIVDLFSTTGNARIDNLKSMLVTYRGLLFASRLSNNALTDLPLPRTLDPSQDVPLPGRLRTLAILIKDTIVCLIQFPLFAIPFIFHIPFYIVGLLGARLAEDELETQAQNKIFLSVFLSLLAYPAFFFIFFFFFSAVGPIGIALAAGAVWLVRKYHLALIDQNYRALKQLVAAWRVLVGVWLGPSAEMTIDDFVDRATRLAPKPPAVAGLPPDTPREKYVRPDYLPSRRLVHQVLRQRGLVARELASTLIELEELDVPLRASFWLAEQYGGEVVPAGSSDVVPSYERDWPQGVRSAREVVSFLRARGAAVQTGEDHWAASRSDGDKSE